MKKDRREIVEGFFFFCLCLPPTQKEIISWDKPGRRKAPPWDLKCEIRFGSAALLELGPSCQCVCNRKAGLQFFVLASSFKNCDLSTKKEGKKPSNHWCFLIPIMLRPHPRPACLRTLQLFLITSPRKHVWPEDGGEKNVLQIIPDTAPEGVCLGALTISVMLARASVTLETWAGHETGEGWQKQISNQYLARRKTLPPSRACSSLVCMLFQWVTLFAYNCCLLQWGVAVTLKYYYIHQTIYSISKPLLFFPCKRITITDVVKY